MEKIENYKIIHRNEVIDIIRSIAIIMVMVGI